MVYAPFVPETFKPFPGGSAMKKWSKDRYAKELAAVKANGKYGLNLPNPHPKGELLRGGKLIDAR
jgi:hypothetical protein